MFRIKNIHNKTKGETLVEVLISVVVLTTVLTSAFLVLSRAVKANIDVKNRIIAINIAREGIEAVRNIRDSNWLRFSGDRRNKWLCVNGETPCEEMATGFYTIEFKSEDQDSPEEFILTDVANTSALNLDIESYKYYQDFRLYIDKDTGRYTYETVENSPTIFYRQIELEVDDNVETPGGDRKKLKVISRVGWMEEGQSKEVVLETHLYDFYERTEY